MARRLLMLVAGLMIFCLTVGSVALAATPQEIYDDLANDSKLDGSYSCKELRAAVGDATLNQYGDQTILDGIEQAYNKQCGREEYPFTGFQWTVAGIVALVLIGGGFGLRRYARTRGA